MSTQKVLVSRAKNQTRSEASEQLSRDVRKLFVGGVPALTTFNEFKRYFLKFGPVSDIMLPTKSKDSQFNCGFGFVTYEDPESAMEVLKTKNQHSFRAKWVA